MCVSDKPLAGQKQNDIIVMFFPQTKREEQLVILARLLKSLTVSPSTIPWPADSLNFIRLLRVVFTPSVTSESTGR